MPLCQPAVVTNSKLQWINIKQDTHFAIQECKIVGGLKSWWSSGDISWAYRVILSATETQIAYAGDITQIVSDWELVQKLISEEPPLDPEASPSASAAALERVLKQHWEAKQADKEKTHTENEKEKGKEKEKEKEMEKETSEKSSAGDTPTGDANTEACRERRSSSRIFFRRGLGSTSTSTSTAGVKPSLPAIMTLFGVGGAPAPFPGIPLHREGGLQPLSPRSHPTSESTGSGGCSGGGEDEKPKEGSMRSADVEAAVQNNEETGRERELREKFERSLDALEKSAEPAILQHDDRYRVYVDCIDGILHELRVMKRGGPRTAPGASEEAEQGRQTTAEMLCLLSRTSLDAARMMVAQRKAAHDRKLAAGAAAVEPNGPPAAAGGEEDPKAKEGQGDADAGSGDAEKAMALVSTEERTEVDQTPAGQGVEAAIAAIGAKESTEEDVRKRLQRCMELFAAANKSLASMTQSDGLTHG